MLLTAGEVARFDAAGATLAGLLAVRSEPLRKAGAKDNRGKMQVRCYNAVL